MFRCKCASCNIKEICPTYLPGVHTFRGRVGSRPQQLLCVNLYLYIICFNLTSTIIVASYPVLKIKGARVNVFIHVYMPPEKVNNHQHTTTGVTILGGDYFATSDAHILPSLYKVLIISLGVLVHGLRLHWSREKTKTRR